MKQSILILAFFSSQSIYAAAESKEFDAKDLNEVVVENTSGKISISAIDGAKAFVTTAKNKFSEKCKLTTERSGSKLELKVEKNSGVFSSAECDVDFDVKVPKMVDLDITAGSSDLTIVGTQGELDFKLGSGSVSADGSFKKIDGKSGNGKISVNGLTGGGVIRNGSGAINLTFASTALKGELDLKTGSGETVLLFPKGSHIKTKYHSGSGQLSNELGDHPTADFKISMKAGSGDLKIRSY